MPTRAPTTGPGARNRALTVSARALPYLLLAAVITLTAGCRPNKRYDLIEAELRTRDRELAETRQALEQARTLNRAFEQSQARPAPVAGAPVSAGPPVGVRDIALARGTGGVDDDGLPGDEAVMVVVVPEDEDRSAVKVPGRLQIAAWEINPQGLKTPIGTWDIPADRLRPTWRSGLIATGYFVTVPWQTFPVTERVRIAVRFTTTDGQAFEADRDISVRPVPQAVPRVNPPAGPVIPDAAIPSPAPAPAPSPAQPVNGREPLYPAPPPPGVPPSLPPGTEELPPPAGLPPRPGGARLLPPVKQ